MTALGVDILPILYLAMGLSIVGMFSKYKIFLILSIGPILCLAFEYATVDSSLHPASPLIVTSMAGWIIFNVYLAFYGGSNE